MRGIRGTPTGRHIPGLWYDEWKAVIGAEAKLHLPRSLKILLIDADYICMGKLYARWRKDILLEYQVGGAVYCTLLEVFSILQHANPSTNHIANTLFLAT